MPNHMPFTRKACKENFSIDPRHSLPAKNVAMAIEKAGYTPKATKKQNCNMAFNKKIHLPLPHYTQDEKDCGNDFNDGVNHSTDELHEMAAAADIKGHTKMNRSNLCRSLINAGVNVSVGGRPVKNEEAMPVVPPRLSRQNAMLAREPYEIELGEFEGRRKPRNSKRRPTSKSACKNRSMTWVKRHKSKSNGKKVMVRGSCRVKNNRHFSHF
jgi:hypothetical protein